MWLMSLPYDATTTWSSYYVREDGVLTWVEGCLSTGQELDVAASADCLAEAAWPLLAEAAWAVGRVLRSEEAPAPCLVVPSPFLSSELIAEALRRDAEATKGGASA